MVNPRADTTKISYRKVLNKDIDVTYMDYNIFRALGFEVHGHIE